MHTSWLFFGTAVISAVAVLSCLHASLQISNSVRFESKEWRRFSQLFDQTLDELFLEYDTPDSALSELRERITALGLTRHHFRKEDNFYLFTNFQNTVLSVSSVLLVWLVLYFSLKLCESDENEDSEEEHKGEQLDSTLELAEKVGSDAAGENEFRAYHSLVLPLMSELKQRYTDLTRQHGSQERSLADVRDEQPDGRLTRRGAKLIRRGQRGCDVISVVNCELRGSLFSQRLVFLWNSLVWNSLVNVLVLLHILVSVLESEQMGDPNRCPSHSSSRWLNWCNLEKKRPSRALLAMVVLINLVELLDVLARVQAFYWCIRPHSSTVLSAGSLARLNCDPHEFVALGLHLLCLCVVSLDNVVMEPLFGLTLEFILPLRTLLLILRNPAVSRHCQTLFQSIWNARAVLYLFGTFLLICSLFSVVLYSGNWGLTRADLANRRRLNDRDDRSMRKDSPLQVSIELTSAVLARMGAEDGIPSLQSGLFGELTRSLLTVFVAIVSAENIVDLVFPIWLNPIHDSQGVSFVWFLAFLGLWTVTPTTIAAFSAAWSVRRREMEQRRRRHLRSAIICSAVLLDSDESGDISQLEFVKFTRDISELSTDQSLRLFHKLDGDGCGKLSLFELVIGVETIVESHIFELPNKERAERVNRTVFAHYYYRPRLRRVLTLARILLLSVQTMALVLLSLNSEHVPPKQQRRLDWLVWVGLLFHCFDVFLLNLVVLFRGNLFAYFRPTLFVSRQHAHSEHWDQIAHTDEVIHRLDAVLCAFCVLTHAVVVLCSGISFGRWTLFPWHSENGHSQSSLLSDDSSLRFDWDLSSHHRIWMSVSIARWLFVFELPRLLISTLVRTFRRMIPLFALSLTFLMLFANFAVVLFRSHSLYSGVHVFRDMGTALTTFAQLQIGEAFHDVLYQSVDWHRGWFWGLWFGVGYHVFLAVLVGDLFFSLLLSESEELFEAMFDYSRHSSSDDSKSKSSRGSSSASSAHSSTHLSLGSSSSSSSSSESWRRLSSEEETQRLKEMLAKEIDFREDSE